MKGGDESGATSTKLHSYKIARMPGEGKPRRGPLQEPPANIHRVSPTVLYFASGESLYSGAVILLLAVVTSSWPLRRCLNWVRRIAIWIGLALMIMACPPFSWIVETIFGLTVLVWLTVDSRTSSGQGRGTAKMAARGALVGLLVLLSAIEFGHRRIPDIRGIAGNRVIVLGDSISSGLGTRVQPWPAVMQQMTGVVVENLSKQGATVADGVGMASQIRAEDHLAVIELGGNDLIAGEPSDSFAHELEMLLAKVAAPGRTLVMFELPLLPHMIGYGRAQRRLAARYAFG